MNNQWTLDTHGDPLGKVRDFIKQVWLVFGLDGMLVTKDGINAVHANPQYINRATSIDEINPFKPLMEINAARLIPALLTDHPEARLGALLRPCEMRAVIEMTRHASLDLNRLLTFSVDCLGTLPADEYQWRLERIEKFHPIGSHSSTEGYDELAQEALKFARQGGVTPYRFRSACQVCISPAANQANINLHLLGLPVRQQILVSVNDPKIAEAIHLERLADGRADNSLILQHQRLLSKMTECHQRTMERIKEGLGSLLPVDLDELIQQLESCGECQNCMDVCPICSVDRPARSADGHYDRAGVMRWLVSCAGCGMCEQACSSHLPISAIFAHIHQQLAQPWEYDAGKLVNRSVSIN